jgi:hypothetical protein
MCFGQSLSLFTYVCGLKREALHLKEEHCDWSYTRKDYKKKHASKILTFNGGVKLKKPLILVVN